MTPRRSPWTWLALVALAGFFVLRSAGPAWSGAVPACQFHRLTGLHCPGCGGTRSALRLLDFDLAGAFAMNAAVALLALAALVLLLLAARREWKGTPVGVPPAGLVWCFAGFVVVFGLVRNLPWWPFTLLAPF